MKTFAFLFIIAVSLPADAQRVKENVRQYTEIIDESAIETPVVEPKPTPAPPKKVRPGKNTDAPPKQ